MLSSAQEQSSINLLFYTNTIGQGRESSPASPAWRIEKLIQIHHNNLVMEFFKEREESTRTDKFR